MDNFIMVEYMLKYRRQEANEERLHANLVRHAQNQPLDSRIGFVPSLMNGFAGWMIATGNHIREHYQVNVLSSRDVH